jgi:hypothetical protein
MYLWTSFGVIWSHGVAGPWPGKALALNPGPRSWGIDRDGRAWETGGDFPRLAVGANVVGKRANGATGSAKEDESPKPCKAEVDFAASAPAGLPGGAGEKKSPPASILRELPPWPVALKPPLNRSALAWNPDAPDESCAWAVVEGVGIGVAVGLDVPEVGIDWKLEAGATFAELKNWGALGKEGVLGVGHKESVAA